MRVSLVLIMLVVTLGTSFGQPRATHAAAPIAPAQWGMVVVPNQDPAITTSGYFVYPMTPDARVDGQVLLRNPSATAVTIDLTTVTAETAQTGGSAFATEPTAAAGSVAGWIALSAAQATVEPGTERTISFAVHAPAGVKPGQYLAGIAASEAPVAAAAGSAEQPGLGASVTMRARYVIAVQADIAGAWTAALSIPTVSVLDQPSGAVVGVQLRNDGDTFLKPSGRIVITDAAGKQLIGQAIAMGTFVPGTAVTYPIRWPGTPAAGSYTVAVDLGYAEGQHATYNGTFEVTGAVAQHAAERADAVAAAPQLAAPAVASGIQPWMLYSLGGLLLLITLLLALNLRRGSAGRTRG